MADVFCPSCKGCFHKTTDSFDPNRPMTGDMFHAKQICRDRMWWTFPEFHYVREGEIECPNCGTLYINNGKILLDIDYEKRPRKIPDDYNPVLLEWTARGKTPTEIAEAFNFTKQAVGRRLYDIRRKEEDGKE